MTSSYYNVVGRTGGAVDYKLALDEEVEKDPIVSSIIPETISECSLVAEGKGTNHCMSKGTLQRIGKELNIKGDVITNAKKKLGCDSEKCILHKLEDELGDKVVKRELLENYKIKGPTDTKLLNNINIDTILKQWMLSNKEFFAYNFNMIDYAKHRIENGEVLDEPDTLATINFKDLYEKGYRCAACVINTDKSDGNGKHWMALFADTRTKPWTIEFFNSSGNLPAIEWVNWQVKTKSQMESIQGAATPTIIKVCDIRHQKSKSECGLYALFYIYSRLNKISYKYFKENPVPDQIMFEFRQHLFNDGSNVLSGNKFNFEEYQKKVAIKWES